MANESQTARVDMMTVFLNWCGSIAVLCSAVFLIGATDQPTKEALKVSQALRTIEAHVPRSDGTDLSVAVTESELNAYIAYRLNQEKISAIDKLTVDLLANNRIQGMVRFDAHALQLDTVLGGDLHFDFKGILITRDGAARIDLIFLQLNDQPVNPQVLDFLLSMAASDFQAHAGDIAGWYDLPKGVKRINIQADNAILYY